MMLLQSKVHHSKEQQHLAHTIIFLSKFRFVNIKPFTLIGNYSQLFFLSSLENANPPPLKIDYFMGSIMTLSRRSCISQIVEGH